MKNTKLVKIGLGALNIIFIVTALVYKIYGASNMNVSKAATNKATETTQTSTSNNFY